MYNRDWCNHTLVAWPAWQTSQCTALRFPRRWRRGQLHVNVVDIWIYVHKYTYPMSTVSPLPSHPSPLVTKVYRIQDLSRQLVSASFQQLHFYSDPPRSIILWFLPSSLLYVLTLPWMLLLFTIPLNCDFASASFSVIVHTSVCTRMSYNAGHQACKVRGEAWEQCFLMTIRLLCKEQRCRRRIFIDSDSHDAR